MTRRGAIEIQWEPPPHIISCEKEYIYPLYYIPTIDEVRPPPTPPTEDLYAQPSNNNLHKNSTQPISKRTLHLEHHDISNITPVSPSYTPYNCKNITKFESLNIHMIFGCRRFRNQHYLTSATNASLVKSVLLPSTIGSFATIMNPPKEKSTKKCWKYLDKVHMDIVFGDCVDLRGHRYTPLLIYVATRYCWLYGMSSLSSASITSDLETFTSESGQLPQPFHSDFDKKLIEGKAL